MTFFQMMYTQFSAAQILDFFIRLALASLCGALIGFERSRRLKDAGVRTHVIVSCAAALIMIVSKYGFVDLGMSPDHFISGIRGADPARLAAQVVSGVGFLGAGTIFHQKNLTRGLTTAAGIWATAAIGLAMGAGMFRTGLLATAIIMIVLWVIHFFSYGASALYSTLFDFVVNDKGKFSSSLKELQDSIDGKVQECSIRKEEGKYVFQIEMLARKDLNTEELTAFIDQHEEILSGSVHYQ